MLETKSSSSFLGSMLPINIDIDIKCMSECAAKQLNFLDDNGKFGPGIIELFLLSDAEKPLDSDLYKKCDKMANESNVIVDSLPSKCNGAAAKFSMCMAMYLFTSCPQDKKVIDQQCATIQTLNSFMKPMLKMN